MALTQGTNANQPASQPGICGIPALVELNPLRSAFSGFATDRILVGFTEAQSEPPQLLIELSPTKLERQDGIEAGDRSFLAPLA